MSGRGKILDEVIAALRAQDGIGTTEEAVAVVVALKGTKPPRAVKVAVEPSERGMKFAEWFASLLPPTMTPDRARARKWALCYDALVARDGRTPEEIAAVCRWARGNDFWQKNFFSPVKLREKKDGVSYFDRFRAAMNPQEAKRAVQKTREYVTERKPGVIE